MQKNKIAAIEAALYVTAAIAAGNLVSEPLRMASAPLRFASAPFRFAAAPFSTVCGTISAALAAPAMATEESEEEKIIVRLRRVRAKIYEAKQHGAAVRVYEAGAEAIDSERRAGKATDYLKSRLSELEVNVDGQLARIKRLNPTPPKLVDAPASKGKRLISPLLFPTRAEMKYLMQQVATPSDQSKGSPGRK